MANASLTSPSPPATRRKSRRTPNTGMVFFVLVVLAMAGLLIGFGPSKLIEMLYHPLIGIVLLVMLVEYVVLKSTDRTRVYRLENQKLRERHRRESALLRRAEEALDPATETDPTAAEALREEIRAEL